MRRTEVIVQIHAWLEERELPGLEPAFRARLTCPAKAVTLGAASVADLHRAIDELLSDVFHHDPGDRARSTDAEG
jgi:hypothetical protein